MEVFGSEGNFVRDSSLVEKFVRLLLSENEISLARNLLNSLGEEYLHLLLELELKVGNYKRAVEIFNMLPEERRQNYLHLINTAEQGAQEVVLSLEKVLSNLYNDNYPLAYAELQRLKREFPQVVEVLALEILTSLKRGDKKRARTLAELLKKLDRTHPVLSKLDERGSLPSLLLPVVAIVVLLIVLLNFLVSLNIYWKSPTISFGRLESEVTNVSRNLQVIRDVLAIVERKLTTLEQTTSESVSKVSPSLADATNSTADLEAKLTSIVKYLELVDEKLGEIMKNEKQLSVVEKLPTAKTRDVDPEELEKIYAELNKISSLYKSTSDRVETLLKLTNNIAIRLSGQSDNPQIRAALIRMEDFFKRINERIQEMNIPINLVQKLADQIEILRKSQTDLISRLELLRVTVEKLNAKVEAIQSAQGEINSTSAVTTVDTPVVRTSPNTSVIPIARDSQRFDDSQFRLMNEELQMLKKEIETLSTMLKSSYVELEKISRLELSVKEISEKLSELDTKISATSGANGTVVPVTPDKAGANKQSTQSPVETTQVQANVSEIGKVIEQTKDLRELFILGLRYYSNYHYDASAKIFEYLEDLLEGIDIYFAEDVYYYLVSSYLKLGQTDMAKKYFQKYVEKYPSGDYVKELELYLRK